MLKFWKGKVQLSVIGGGNRKIRLTDQIINGVDWENPAVKAINVYEFISKFKENSLWFLHVIEAYSNGSQVFLHQCK